MTNEQLMLEYGYDGITLFDNPSFEGALIGVSTDFRAVYDYDLMVQSLMQQEGWTEEEAIEWIDYNTIRSLPYEPNSPIIVYGFH